MTAPLTLAEVREIDAVVRHGHYREEYAYNHLTGMAATVEWLVERVGVSWATCETCRFGPSCETHECDVAEQQVRKWLRGEA